MISRKAVLSLTFAIVALASLAGCPDNSPKPGTPAASAATPAATAPAPAKPAASAGSSGSGW
jgi:hypothetical protein